MDYCHTKDACNLTCMCIGVVERITYECLVILLIHCCRILDIDCSTILLQAMLAVLARHYSWQKADPDEQMVWPVQPGALKVNIQRLPEPINASPSESSPAQELLAVH